MKFDVRHEGEVFSLEAYALQYSLETGDIPIDIMVRHRVYTGNMWKPASVIPIFAKAMQTPVARLSARMDNPRIPWITLLVALGVLLGYSLQPSQEIWHLANGWVNLTLEDRWYCIFLSVFVQQTKFHMLSNLLLLLYPKLQS